VPPPKARQRFRVPPFRAPADRAGRLREPPPRAVLLGAARFVPPVAFRAPAAVAVFRAVAPRGAAPFVAAVFAAPVPVRAGVCPPDFFPIRGSFGTAFTASVASDDARAVLRVTPRWREPITRPSDSAERTSSESSSAAALVRERRIKPRATEWMGL
jgi:hypothetical protein